MSEPVYMELPIGSCIFTNHVYFYYKSLYGLKQTPRQCFKKLLRCFQGRHFFFILDNHGDKLYRLAYTNDVIITGNKSTLIIKLLANLQTQLPIKDLGPLSYFLSIEAYCSKERLLLT